MYASERERLVSIQQSGAIGFSNRFCSIFCYRSSYRPCLDIIADATLAQLFVVVLQSTTKAFKQPDAPDCIDRLQNETASVRPHSVACAGSERVGGLENAARGLLLFLLLGREGRTPNAAADNNEGEGGRERGRRDMRCTA